MSHHANDPQQDGRMHAMMKQMFGEYPNGKLNEQDEGALPVGIGVQGGRVVITFPKSVTWIGFTPDQALDIAASLVEHARKCGSTKPLVMKIG